MNDRRAALRKHRQRSMTAASIPATGRRVDHPPHRSNMHAMIAMIMSHPRSHGSHLLAMPGAPRCMTTRHLYLQLTRQLTDRSLRRRPHHKERHQHRQHVSEPHGHNSILTEARAKSHNHPHLSSSDTSSSAVSPPPSIPLLAPPASSSSPRASPLRSTPHTPSCSSG